MSERSAQNYMRVAKHYAKSASTVNLPATALYKIAAKATIDNDTSMTLGGLSGWSEKALENAIVSALLIEGVAVERQVICSIGTIDIVIPTAVIEVKFKLNRFALFHAIGQVLLYRQVFDPNRRAVIIGFPDQDAGVAEMIVAARVVGVEVIFWVKT